jgi:putative DNA primase/helicase
VRFDFRRARYLLWRGHRWQPDADAEIRRLAKAAMRRRFTDAAVLDNPDERSRAAKWAIGSESRSRLDGLLYLAQAEPPIADAGEQWDADPWVLGVPNGVIDLRTGTLRPGRRDDRITMSGTVPYDPTAACPRWERFNAEVFVDPALVGFVHRAMGYSLTGETGEQCLFLGYGTGANGKGTFTNTLAETLGDYAYAMPFSTVELHQRTAIPNDLAALVGRRLVVASETTDGARLNEPRLKALTGCDPITARFLHSEFFTFRPVAKFWLSVNHRPIVRDDSHGFWRRMRLIPFTQTFPVNPTLADELRAEAPGILAWAVRGCLAWQREGLNPPAAVLDATRDYERDSDPVAEFLDEACEREPNAQAGASELYEHYKRWADRHSLSDRERLTSTMFGRKMTERFVKVRDRTAGVIYRGVARRTGDT